MKLTGAWKGEYVFDENAEAPRMGGHVVPFSVDIQEGWFGMVRGEIKEDARSGFPEAGKIRGRFAGGKLRFSKHMPVLRMLHEPGLVSLERWAERRQFVMDTEEPHPAIHFSGELSADGNSMAGKWHMREFKLNVPGSAQALMLPELRGRWKAARQQG